MTASEILKDRLDNWGEKDSYLVSEEEFRTLQLEGGVVHQLNHSNGDGTFSHSLVFQSYSFIFFSTQEIGGIT